MKINLDLSTDESIALRRLANELGCSLEDGAKTGLRAWLIKNGYLDSAEADNDNSHKATLGEG
jgi:hypothetical protein